MVFSNLKCFWFFLAAPYSLAQPVPIRPVFRNWWGRLEVRAAAAYRQSDILIAFRLSLRAPRAQDPIGSGT